MLSRNKLTQESGTIMIMAMIIIPVLLTLILYVLNVLILINQKKILQNKLHGYTLGVVNMIESDEKKIESTIETALMKDPVRWMKIKSTKLHKSETAFPGQKRKNKYNTINIKVGFAYNSPFPFFSSKKSKKGYLYSAARIQKDLTPPEQEEEKKQEVDVIAEEEIIIKEIVPEKTKTIVKNPDLNVQLIMCVDATGSMKPLIEGVKRLIKNIPNEISNMRLQSQEGNHVKIKRVFQRIIFFRDVLEFRNNPPFEEPVNGYPSDTPSKGFNYLVGGTEYMNSSKAQQELKLLVNGIGNINADGGGDTPESILECLSYALYSTKTIDQVYTDGVPVLIFMIMSDTCANISPIAMSRSSRSNPVAIRTCILSQCLNMDLDSETSFLTMGNSVARGQVLNNIRINTVGNFYSYFGDKILSCPTDNYSSWFTGSTLFAPSSLSTIMINRDYFLKYPYKNHCFNRILEAWPQIRIEAKKMIFLVKHTSSGEGGTDSFCFPLRDFLSVSLNRSDYYIGNAINERDKASTISRTLQDILESSIRSVVESIKIPAQTVIISVPTKPTEVEEAVHKTETQDASYKDYVPALQEYTPKKFSRVGT